MISSKKLGFDGEKHAAEYLTRNGYKIIARNFQCKLGEIDLIATIDDFLVFVEVKTKTDGKNAVHPLLSITNKKQKQVRKVASYYLALHQIQQQQPRFDAIGVSKNQTGMFQLEHIINAF
ncbi:MAG: putative endonuclease [bacterium]|jgi:putative endonuclease